MISGVTMGPGSNAAWSGKATSLGADTAYPYSGQDLTDSVESVAAQSLGSNAATYTAYYTILAAEATSSSPVDIIAYSGGAGAFAAAWELTERCEQADIGSIVYLTPGSLGASLPTNVSTSTFVGGAGPENGTAGLGTIPVGFVTDTSCDHTDLTCFFNQAAGPLGKIAAHGNCASPQSATLQEVVAGLGAATNATQQQLFSSWWRNLSNYYVGEASEFLNWVGTASLSAARTLRLIRTFITTFEPLASGSYGGGIVVHVWLGCSGNWLGGLKPSRFISSLWCRTSS